MRVLCICLLALIALPATAHDWYGGTRDPVTQDQCCGERECHRIDATAVLALPNGDFLVRPHKWVIPRERVQASPDMNYHICEGMRPGRDDVYKDQFGLHWLCFFAPAGTAEKRSSSTRAA